MPKDPAGSVMPEAWDLLLETAQSACRADAATGAHLCLQCLAQMHSSSARYCHNQPTNSGSLMFATLSRSALGRSNALSTLVSELLPASVSGQTLGVQCAAQQLIASLCVSCSGEIKWQDEVRRSLRRQICSVDPSASTHMQAVLPCLPPAMALKLLEDVAPQLSGGTNSLQSTSASAGQTENTFRLFETSWLQAQRALLQSAASGAMIS